MANLYQPRKAQQWQQECQHRYSQQSQPIDAEEGFFPQPKTEGQVQHCQAKGGLDYVNKVCFHHSIRWQV